MLGPADVGEAESLEEGDVFQDFLDSILFPTLCTSVLIYIKRSIKR